MGRTNIAFLQSPTQGDTGTKCADVAITPEFGDMPLTVSLETPQSGGHIFYRISGATPPLQPQHSGDNAISPTVRIGTNIGSVFLGSGTNKFLTAVCYQSGFLDSNITLGTYERPDSGL